MWSRCLRVSRLASCDAGALRRRSRYDPVHRDHGPRPDLLQPATQDALPSLDRHHRHRLR